MKSQKILLASIMLVFLLNFASAAIIVDTSWQGDVLDISITEGESITLNLNTIYSTTPSMTINVILYDSANVPTEILPNTIVTGDSSSSYSNSFSISPSVGTYDVITTGTDEDGAISQKLTLTVNSLPPTPDTIAPVITLLGSDEIEVVIGSTYTDAGATALDDVDEDITSSIVIYNPVDTDEAGDYIITYNVQDAAGNNAIEVTRKVIVNPDAPDTTDPTIEIIIPEEGVTYNAPVEYFNFKATDANLKSCSYSVDNGVTIVPTSCTSGILKVLDLTSVEGTNTWIVYAEDDAGNTAQASVTFIVDTSVPDTTDPTINVISPEATIYDTSTITFEIVTDENTPIVEMSLNGGVSITMSNPTDHVFTYNLTGLADGTHIVVFYAEDVAGNSATESITFAINTSDEEDDKTNSIGYLSLEDGSDDIEYLEQFKPKTIYLDEEELEEELSWFQKLINWLKRLFGLK